MVSWWNNIKFTLSLPENLRREYFLIYSMRPGLLWYQNETQTSLKRKKNFYRPVSFMNIDVQILKAHKFNLTVNEKDNTSFAFPGIQSWFSIWNLMFLKRKPSKLTAEENLLNLIKKRNLQTLYRVVKH